MLSISHSLTGAFIAAKVGNPVIATPLILASHYLEDWIPHWDVGTGLSNGTRRRSHAIIMELIELAISVGLIWLLWHRSDPTTLFNVWYGAFVGLLPDFIEAPRNFLKWEPFFTKPLNRLHGQFHHSTPHKVLGLLPQLGLWGLIAVLK